ncbi:MAG: DMT family transporter [Candidatus Heimdallarchaeota archaeon]
MSASTLVLAIFLQLFSTSVNNIGMTIQKKAANEMPRINEEAGIFRSIKNMITSKAWMFGLLLNVSSTFLAAGSLYLASISFIQPIYGFGLIVLVAFTHYYLKEKITKIDIVGVVLGIIGIVIIGITALFVPVQNPLTYDQLLSKLIDTSGIVFFSVFLVIALITYLISEKTKKSTALVFLVISSSIWTATQNIFNKAVAAAIGDLGPITAFFGEGWLYTWSFIALFLFVSILGVIMLNIAYQNGQGVVVIPIWTSVQVIIPVLSGIIVFSEWSLYDAKDIALQTLGILFMLASIIILSISNGRKEDYLKTQKEEESEDIKIEEAINTTIENNIEEKNQSEDE